MMTIIPRSESLEPAAVVCDFESQTIRRVVVDPGHQELPDVDFCRRNAPERRSGAREAVEEKRADFGLASAFRTFSADILGEKGLTNAVHRRGKGLCPAHCLESIGGFHPRSDSDRL